MPLEKELWLVDQLTMLAEAFGESGEKLSAQRLQIYACDLADLDRSQLEIAFLRARRECKFFPKIAELRELAGANPAQEREAEGCKAWDLLMGFVRKYVGNDIFGNYGPEHGWYPKSYPTLSGRILDVVRRTGGWKAYKCLADADFPFQQRRFFEQYEAWISVEKISPAALLTEAPRRQLVAKPDAHETKGPTPQARSAEVPPFKPKPIPTPLTDVQLRDRRAMLRQQAESLRSRKSTP